MASSFDDLAFSNGGSGAGATQAACAACQATFSIRAGDRLCPSCGLRLIAVSREDAVELERASRTRNEREEELSEAEQQERQHHSDATAAGSRPITTRSEAAAAAAAAGGGGPDEWLGVLSRAMARGPGAQAAGAPSLLLQMLMSQLVGGPGPTTTADAAATTAAGAAAGGDDDAIAAQINQLFGGLGMFGAGQGEDALASPAAVQALRHVQITDPNVDLPRQCSLRLVGGGGAGAAMLECAAVPAAFSAGLLAQAEAGGSAAGGPVAFRGPLVAADPLNCAGPLLNGAVVLGAVALVERGVVSFAKKGAALAAAGAVAACCIQNADVWPYTATDMAGELASAPLGIPFVMLRREDGQRLRRLLETAGGGGEAGHAGVQAVLTFTPLGSYECPICCDPMARGSTALILPCNHAFHEECAGKWLGRRNTCPLCRCALPVAEGSGGGLQREEQLRRERDQMTAQWYR